MIVGLLALGGIMLLSVTLWGLARMGRPDDAGLVTEYERYYGKGRR